MLFFIVKYSVNYKRNEYFLIKNVHRDYLCNNCRCEFIPIMHLSLNQNILKTIQLNIETCWLICICNIDFSIKTICQDIKKKIEHVRFNIYHPTIFILNGKLGYLYVHIKLLLMYCDLYYLKQISYHQ